MYVTAQGPRLRNDLYCVEWDVKLYYAYNLRRALSWAASELYLIFIYFIYDVSMFAKSGAYI